MAGLDNNMLSVIECLAKNKIQDAKNAAIVCCKNDTTKKNAANLNYYQKLLENGNSTYGTSSKSSSLYVIRRCFRIS